MANLRLESLLLADHAVAAPDGKLYINGGGITKLLAPEVPFGLPYLSIVLRFLITREDEGEHSFSVRIKDPNGVDLLSPDEKQLPVAASGGLEDEEHYLQVVMSFGGLPIQALGTHKLIVQLDGEVVRELKLPVVPAPVSAGQPDAAPQAGS